MKERGEDKDAYLQKESRPGVSREHGMSPACFLQEGKWTIHIARWLEGSEARQEDREMCR